MKKSSLRQVFEIHGRIEDPNLTDILQKKIIKTNHIHLFIQDSPGGDANITAKMINLLDKFKRSGGNITSQGDKLVASSALLLYLQGSSRTATKRTKFIIDLPFKSFELKLLLGFEQTRQRLEKLLSDNNNLIIARKQWANRISKTIILSPELVYKLEGHVLNSAEALSLKIIHQIK